MSWVVFCSLTVEDEEEEVLSARERERLGGLEVSTLQKKLDSNRIFYYLLSYPGGVQYIKNYAIIYIN
jgi:hypothetical protein